MNGSSIDKSHNKRLHIITLRISWRTIFKVEVYVGKLNADNDGRIRARFLLYDESNSDFSDYQRLTDARYEEESTIEAD